MFQFSVAQITLPKVSFIHSFQAPARAIWPAILKRREDPGDEVTSWLDSSIKNKTQTAVINILNLHIMT